MLVDQKYPTHHVFLEEVYSKIFYEKGHEVVWVMKSGSKIGKRQVKRWNQNKVYVIPSRFSGILEYVFQIFDLLFLIDVCKRERFDIIQVRNDIVMGHFARLLAWFYGAKFVVQLSHLKAEETLIFAKRGIYGNKFVNYIIGYFEMVCRNVMLRSADLVFPISYEMKKYFARFGVKNRRMVAMPLGVDLRIDPKNYNCSDLIEKYDVGSEIVLVYIGTLSKSRHLDKVVRAMKLLKDDGIKFKLFFVGSGKDERDADDLRKFSFSFDLSSEVVFVGKVARSEVPRYIKMADIGLSPVPLNKVFKRSSITKLGEYMNMGIPCVATKFPEQEKLMLESECGYCVDYRVEDFYLAVKKMVLDGSKKRREMGLRGRVYIRDKRNLNKLGFEVENAYGRMV